MAEISYRPDSFPPVIIEHVVWLYLRFTLSDREVEELPVKRGLDISYELTSATNWVWARSLVKYTNRRCRNPRRGTAAGRVSATGSISKTRFYVPAEGVRAGVNSRAGSHR
jgi:transposase-like protein